MATEEDNPTKRCCRCGETKPLTAFNVRRSHSTGRCSWCRVCVNGLSRKYYHAEKKKIQARRARYLETNRERINDAARAYRAKNQKLIRARLARDRAKDPAKYRAYRARQLAKNAAARRAYASKWARDHKREHWVYRINRRSLRKASGRNIPVAQLQQIMADALGMCAYCGSSARLEIDHIEPLSRGGAHEAENLTVACSTCNRKKNAQPLLVWLAHCANDRRRLSEAA